eukprot:s406_g15.t1
MEDTGNLSLETMKDGPKDEERGYEKGMEVALCPMTATGPSPAPAADAQQVQSLHVMAAKPAPLNSSSTEAAPDSAATAAAGFLAAFVTMPDRGASPEKSVELSSLEGKSLGETGTFLLAKLLEVLPLRSQHTGRRDKTAVFPLPTSRSSLLTVVPDLTPIEISWGQCVVVSLNSMWGGEIQVEGLPSRVQRECLTGSLGEVKRFCGLSTVVEVIDWSDFFKIRSIDYKGDEVKVARWFSWSNIAPALPREIGRVPLEDLCSHGAKHYVLNFDNYLKPPNEWGPLTKPRVMVEDQCWGAVCQGLVSAGVCCFIEEHEIFCTDQGPLLNGLFGVTKDEWTDSGTEIYRLIMNLVPLNTLCRPLSGDVDTLPAWSGMNPFFLQPSQHLLVSSEDVKCFFYTMAVPQCWTKFLAFNKPVPHEVLPPHLHGKSVYIASRVLPMGFLNSVSLAQHVHRTLVLRSGSGSVNAPELEHRKDRPIPEADATWRVYLDNYDLLEKVEATQLVQVEGTTAPGVLALRQQYEHWEVPRNTKKAVTRSAHAELQGATVDGERGIAFPREVKLSKYFSMALALCLQDRATQRQWQVACGGLVYFTMFRRPLLGSLNQIWRHIEDYAGSPTWYRKTPDDCRLEVLRFLGALPLARMDFRLDVHPLVTCSDASTTGGGICVSRGTTPVGRMVAQGSLRGELPETRSGAAVFAVGLFDGIGALRVALDALGVPVLGYVSAEKEASGKRVVETHFPGVITVDDVRDITEEMVRSWSTQFSQCTLVLVGAGPPCQGVSGLNADRLGALRDARSSLFTHVPRVRDLLRRHFVWCPVHTLMESVASMDAKDREIMTEAIGEEPLLCDAGCFTWCHRPRLYWLSWEVTHDESTLLLRREGEVERIEFEGQQPLEQVLRKGWSKVDPTSPFPTFTTSRPQMKAGRKPAGIKQCQDHELQRWADDLHRFPPYQYRDGHCVRNRQGTLRVPDAPEREAMMGFPVGYTVPCVSKQERKGQHYQDVRLTLLGNSWSVPVVTVLISHLFKRLGMIPPLTSQDVLDALAPGTACTVQGRLARLPLNSSSDTGEDHSAILAKKLGNLISIKGEDILLTTATTQVVKHHRLRATVPSRLWRWSIVSGWKWTLGKEHINALEMRAILTSLRWRIEHKGHLNTRLVHLTDSLVSLHCLSRGRSSSRKLRRTVCRVNALVLASNVQPIWAYIHTDQNPADKPSRWGRRIKTKFRDAADLTVQPATRKRYDLATNQFLRFLEKEGHVLPSEKHKMDPLVCDYVEHLWSSGAGRGLACDTLAGLQDIQPNLKNALPGAWRLLKTWHVNEVPNRAPPIPEHVVQTMAGWSFFKGHVTFGVSLLVGFYCMLRTGELLGLRACHFLSDPSKQQVLISLGLTKGGKRTGAAESVILGFEPVVKLVKQWKTVAQKMTPLAISPGQWRGLFNESLSALGLESFGFRPLSEVPDLTAAQALLQRLDQAMIDKTYYCNAFLLVETW